MAGRQLALSDGRKADPKTGKAPKVGNTVDVSTATYTNDIGDAALDDLRRGRSRPAAGLVGLTLPNEVDLPWLSVVSFAVLGIVVAVSLEMLEFPDIDNNGFDGQASQLYPVLSARVTRPTNLDGRIMLGGSIYQLRWDGLETGPNATALGWGFVFSGRQNFSKKFAFLWNASAGEGWATNVLGTLGTGNVAILSPEGDLEPIFMWNLDASFSYSLSPIWVLNIQGGWDELDVSEYKPDASYKAGGTGHLNVIFSPMKSVNLGLEYQIGKRVNKDDKSGVANRIQFMAKYFF